jgi:cell division protein FtsL
MKRFQRRKTLLSGLLFICMFALWAMFHVWTRNLATELGYELSREQAITEQLISDNKALSLEISTLKSTQRLEQIALNQLGMRPPQPGQVVYLWTRE